MAGSMNADGSDPASPAMHNGSPAVHRGSPAVHREFTRGASWISGRAGRERRSAPDRDAPLDRISRTREAGAPPGG
ncbi:MAG: hypothetical protein Q6370_005915, partial [Candidatus Sigynarchaeota archaeon]